MSHAVIFTKCILTSNLPQQRPPDSTEVVLVFQWTPGVPRAADIAVVIMDGGTGHCEDPPSVSEPEALQ